MKRLVKLIIILSILIFVFAACSQEPSPNENTVDTVKGTTSPESTVAGSDADTEDSDTVIVAPPIIENGKTPYTIVIPEKASSTLSDAGNTLKSAFADKFGIKIDLRKEKTFKTLNGGTVEGPKIVLGALEEDNKSKQILDVLYYNSYTIRITNGSLYIMGGHDEATAIAIEYFIENYLSSSVATLNFENGILYEQNDPPVLENITIAEHLVSDYTIVYYNSYFAKSTAYKVQKALANATGTLLPVVSDAKAETDLEILIGKTNRAESVAVRSEYDRPNVNYDIVEKNGKLVIMAEGYTTLGVIENKFNEYLDTLEYNANIVGSAVHGDILESDNMFERADSTDIRVMAWNMGSPGASGRVDLAEKHADVILMHYPDVLGTNEWINSPTHSGYKTLYDTVMREISEYYTIIEDSEIDTTHGTPGKSELPFPQNILYRKDRGLSVSKSGYRLLGTDHFHGYHWAIFKTSEGREFIYSVAHYTNTHDNATCSNIQLDLMKQIQDKSGSDTLLPEIFSGDLYMQYGNVGYNVVPAAGYKDAQREALVNANGNISHGTFHDFGKYQPQRAKIDLVFYNSGFDALKHKVVILQPALDASDHCPVCTDLKFK